MKTNKKTIWAKIISMFLILAMMTVWLQVCIVFAADQPPVSGGGGAPVEPHPPAGGGGGVPVEPPPPDTWDNPFYDVSVSDQFYYAVAFVHENGLMNGTSENMFSPNLTMTRAMAAMIFYRMSGTPDVTGLANPYSDVPEGQFYTEAVIWLANGSVIPGSSNDTFNPNAIATRQDMMVFLVRYADITGLDLIEMRNAEKFEDEEDIADWAMDAVVRCYKANIINQDAYGFPVFPNWQVTRAEFASTIYILAARKDIKSITFHAERPDGSLTQIDVKAQLNAAGVEQYNWKWIAANFDASVTRIDIGAFYGYNQIASIFIPDNIMNISNAAFDPSSYIREINVSSDNTNFSSVDGVLFDKDKTVIIKYPSIKTIGNSISDFYIIPESVESIGAHAFSYCNALKSITIPDSTTTIGDYAFYSCWGLTSITIPKEVAYIGNMAFYWCKNLLEIRVNPDNSNYLSLDGVLFDKDEANLIQYPSSKPGNHYLIPNSVESIGDGAFGGNNNLMSVNIPDSVISIGNQAFWNIQTLISVTVGYNVESIGYYAFGSCYNLANIFITDTVATIGMEAFRGCGMLTINAPKDSVAQKYAVDNNIQWLEWLMENSVIITVITITGGTAFGGGAYAEGEEVILSALSNSDFQFVGWYENNVKIPDVNAIYTFTATANRTLEAHFIAMCAISVTATTGGTVSGGGSCAIGESVTLIATPNSNYEFDGWYEMGIKIPNAGAMYIFTANRNRTIEARFISTSSNSNLPNDSKTPLPTATGITEPEVPLDSGGQTNTQPLISHFTDINESVWYYDDVMYVYKNELMNGISETVFSPDSTLSRAMIVTILWRNEGSPDVEGVYGEFADVAQGSWYETAVGWAIKNEIVKGYGEGLFGPNDPITRQDLAVILERYMSFIGSELNVSDQWIEFADEADISSYAMNAIQTLNKLSIINGIGTNSDGKSIIDPKGTATRAQAAALLHRFVELVTQSG